MTYGELSLKLKNILVKKLKYIKNIGSRKIKASTKLLLIAQFDFGQRNLLSSAK